MMKNTARKAVMLLLAAVCLTGCYKGDGSESAGSTIEESTAAESSAAEESSVPETTVSESSREESSAETSAAEESSAAESSAAESKAPVPSGGVKILWSERGLEAVAPDSEDGYGSPLNTGDTYLEHWTLKSYSGTPNDITASFSCDGEVTANGILTILPASDAHNPNGLYLRVDNQADFPYFPQDSRERGKFIIENADFARKSLELDDQPVQQEYTVAVTVSVTALEVHCAADGFDRITVSAAGKR